MSDLIKAAKGARRTSLDLISAFLVIVGGTMMFAGGAYRVFLRPEWTSEQALETLWPLFVAGAVTVTLGWLVDRAAQL